jgi:hypothetical protein
MAQGTCEFHISLNFLLDPVFQLPSRRREDTQFCLILLEVSDFSLLFYFLFVCFFSSSTFRRRLVQLTKRRMNQNAKWERGNLSMGIRNCVIGESTEFSLLQEEIDEHYDKFNNLVLWFDQKNAEIAFVEQQEGAADDADWWKQGTEQVLTRRRRNNERTKKKIWEDTNTGHLWYCISIRIVISYCKILYLRLWERQGTIWRNPIDKNISWLIYYSRTRAIAVSVLYFAGIRFNGFRFNGFLPRFPPLTHFFNFSKSTPLSLEMLLHYSHSQARLFKTG